MKLTHFGFGALTLVPGIDPIPATSKQSGAFTINEAGSPGRPAFFSAQFSIHAASDHGVLGVAPSELSLTTRLPSPRGQALYDELELAAARRLPEMLREIATLIEADLERAATGARSRNQ